MYNFLSFFQKGPYGLWGNQGPHVLFTYYIPHTGRLRGQNRNIQALVRINTTAISQMLEVDPSGGIRQGSVECTVSFQYRAVITCMYTRILLSYSKHMRFVSQKQK